MKVIEIFESAPTIRLNSKLIRTTVSSNGYHPVLTNVSIFDKAWRNSELYIGEGGSGQIKDRYQRFGLFVMGGTDAIGGHTFEVEPATSIELSDVNVSSNGDISFVNGRHRYAWLRDKGVDPIPVAMDNDSIENARRFNYIQ